MLGTISETPVDSLSITTSLYLDKAKTLLNNQLLALQSKGWHWNTDEQYVLSPDVNGELQLPANTLKVDINDPDHCDLDLVWRGQRLYDRKKHTYEIAEEIKVDIVVGLPFDEMPQIARQYVTVASAILFQTQELASTPIDQQMRDDALEAWTRLQDEEASVSDANMLTGSITTYRIVRR